MRRRQRGATSHRPAGRGLDDGTPACGADVGGSSGSAVIGAAPTIDGACAEQAALDEGRAEDHDEQHDADRRGVPEVELGERGVVQVQHHGHQRVVGIAGRSRRRWRAWSNSWSAPMTATVATK